MHPSSVAFPLRGEWTALQTPAERVPSHGTDFFGQRYAFDFARLQGKFPKHYSAPIHRHLLGRVHVEECYAWAQPVFAPFAGRVVAAGDGWPDRERLNFLGDLFRSTLSKNATVDDYRPLTGNYMMISGAPGVALLAHLRRGSVRLSAGETVAEGEQIGEVGNSGNSTTPHLHFQVMDRPNPFEAEGLQCSFQRYETFRDGIWSEVRDGIPGAFEQIRFLPDDSISTVSDKRVVQKL
ncbi:MAG TPA: M23 family metallopeptidase [Thermoanaerobaculia bacterium]|nr:M23 family metallopeptidase [Thermoanaerobaculia bacterium]